MATVPPAKRARADGCGTSTSQPAQQTEELSFSADDVPLPGTCVFVKEPSSSLNCPICMSVLSDAATLLGCQHVFCRKCIREALTRKRECPTCRQKCSPISRFGLAKDSQNSWAACKGPHMCTKVLPIDEVASHEASCQYARVTCPFQGCGCVVLRSEMEIHLERNMGKHLMLMQSALELKDKELANRDVKLAQLESRVSKVERKLDDMGMVLATVMEDNRGDQTTTRGGGDRPRVWKWDERRQVLTEVPLPRQRGRRLLLGDSEEETAPGRSHGAEESAAAQRRRVREDWQYEEGVGGDPDGPLPGEVDSVHRQAMASIQRMLQASRQALGQMPAEEQLVSEEESSDEDDFSSEEESSEGEEDPPPSVFRHLPSGSDSVVSDMTGSSEEGSSEEDSDDDTDSAEP